jgi:hypothetical protein
MTSASTAAEAGAVTPDAQAALRLMEQPSSWTNRFLDRLNPIFVKETRQALRSRQFLGTFFALLLVSWLVSIMQLLSGPARLESTGAGRELFASYFIVLSAAILVVVPYGAFRSLISEREEATFEPLIITTLTPRQIVLGKLASAMLQTFLFYSAIAPFMSFTALLQGFDIANVALVLSLGVLASLGASIAALAIASTIKGRVWQSVISLGVLGGLVMAFSTSWGLVWALEYVVDWGNPWFVWGLASWIVAGLSYVVLLQQVAVSNLTFPADNRSTGLRLICEGQFVLLWLGIAASLRYLGTRAVIGRVFDELVVVGIILSLAHWAAAGLFFVTEPDELSRRVARRLPRPALVRLLVAPFYPGGARGLLLVLGNVALVVGLAWAQIPLFGRTFDSPEVLCPLAMCLYLTIYLNVGAAIARWGMAFSNAVQPLHARGITLLTIALSLITPMFLLLVDPYQRIEEHPLLYLPNPFLTIEYLGRRTLDHPRILFALGVLAVLSLMVNLPAVFRGLAVMVRTDPRRLSQHPH